MRTTLVRYFSRIPRNVIALGLVSFFNDASGEIIYPLLPIFLTGALGASVQFVGLIEGVTESASSLLKLPAGWLSDRVGRRKGLIVFGYALASLIRPLLALANVAWQVLGLRFIDRLGKGVRSGPRDALLADSVSAEKRGLVFGFHRAMDHIGAIAGALLSSWLIVLFQGNFRHVFWASAIPALVAVLILIFAVKEEKAGDRETELHGDEVLEEQVKKKVLGQSEDSVALPKVSSLFDRNFKIYLGVLLLFALGNSSDAFLLLRAQQSGIGLAMIPLLWAVLHISKTVSSVIGGELSDRIGRKKLIVGGWLIYAGIYLAFALANTQFEMWLLFIGYGLYFGLTEGVEKALIADLSPKQARGTAFGFYNLVIGIGALPASLLTGFLWKQYGPGAALATGAGLSLVAAVLMTLMVREHADVQEHSNETRST